MRHNSGTSSWGLCKRKFLDAFQQTQNFYTITPSFLQPAFEKTVRIVLSVSDCVTDQLIVSVMLIRSVIMMT